MPKMLCGSKPSTRGFESFNTIMMPRLRKFLVACFSKKQNRRSSVRQTVMQNSTFDLQALGRKNNLPPKSSTRRWKNVNEQDIKSFLGLGAFHGPC